MTQNKIRIRKPKVPSGCSRVFDGEKSVSKHKLENFTVEGSLGLKLVEELAGEQLKSISKNKITQMAYFYSIFLDIPISRNDKRGKKILLKWFDDNYESIKYCGISVMFKCNEVDDDD